MKEDRCIRLVVLLRLHTERWMGTKRGRPWHSQDATASWFAPSPMPREKKESALCASPSKYIHLHWMKMRVGTFRNKVEKKKKQTLFYMRTYNVLEPTSTNTTSTSVWSLRNSWMQYITLTLPCLDPGRQGPERNTLGGQWPRSRVKVSKPHRRVQKRESLRGLHFVCISTCLYIVKRIKTWGIGEDTSSGP